MTPPSAPRPASWRRTVGRLIADELTAHQREVLLAMTIEETPAKVLAARLDSTPGAVYRTTADESRHPGSEDLDVSSGAVQ